jgi:hypothetical protein
VVNRGIYFSEPQGTRGGSLQVNDINPLAVKPQWVCTS